jgi:N-ethylmaleimide reductase
MPKVWATHIGSTIQNSGFDKATGNQIIASEMADAISFGRLFLANPDLPERFLRDAPLNPADPATFYGGNEQGFTDYPFLKL